MFRSDREINREINGYKFIISGNSSALDLIIRIFISLLLGIALALTYSLPVTANQTNPSVGFSVRAIQSERQINQNVSYFDLLLSPGEEHVLEIDVFNNSENPMNALISAYTAGTNSGGVIDYDNPDVTDDSLIASFAEIAEVEDSVMSVPAAGSARARIKLKMPDRSFDGILLGGVVIKKAEDGSLAVLEEVNSTSIQNEYCYVIGVKARVNDIKVKPDFRLRQIEPTLSNYHTSIATNLQNYKAAIAKGVAIEANVYRSGDTQPLYSNSESDFDVAPNSNFDFIIPCSGKLPTGNYRLHLTALHGEKLWEFDEEFTITGAAADNVNDNAVNVPGVDYYRIATIFLSILLITLIAFYIIRRKIENDKKHKSP